LDREFAILLFDFVGVGGFRNTERLVIIFFGRHDIFSKKQNNIRKTDVV